MGNKKWTQEEDKLLYDYRKKDLTCREIHDIMPSRSISAIRCRIQNLGINKIYPFKENQFIDLTGKKFGRLKVVKRANNDKTRHIRWYCDCDCGKKNILVYGQSLKSGDQISCGCYRNEVVGGKKYYNEYDLSASYGIGYCRNTGNQFLFDIEDYEKIKDYCWMEDSNGYIVTFVKRKPIFMHRIVMNVFDSKLEVDHIKHDINDNRKSLLRVLSHSENHKNSKKYKNNTSGITGVYYDKRDNLWYARITCDNVVINIGCFKNRDEAINARKNAEELYFGEFSYNNSMNYNSDFNTNQEVSV